MARLRPLVNFAANSLDIVEKEIFDAIIDCTKTSDAPSPRTGSGPCLAVT
jgi:hypothetical protein